MSMLTIHQNNSITEPNSSLFLLGMSSTVSPHDKKVDWCQKVVGHKDVLLFWFQYLWESFYFHIIQFSFNSASEYCVLTMQWVQSTLDIRVYYFVVVVCMKCVEHMDKACVSHTAEFTILAPHTREDGRIKQGNCMGGWGAPATQNLEHHVLGFIFSKRFSWWC